MVVMVDEEHTHAPSKTWKDCGEIERKRKKRNEKRKKTCVQRANSNYTTQPQPAHTRVDWVK